jgi:hypothetical protein
MSDLVMIRQVLFFEEAGWLRTREPPHQPKRLLPLLSGEGSFFLRCKSPRVSKGDTPYVEHIALTRGLLHVTYSPLYFALFRVISGSLPKGGDHKIHESHETDTNGLLRTEIPSWNSTRD